MRHGRRNRRSGWLGGRRRTRIPQPRHFRRFLAALQFAQEFPPGREAIGWSLGHGFEDQSGQVGRNFRIQFERGNGDDVENLLPNGVYVRAIERLLPGCHLVQDRAPAKDIGPRVQGLTAHLFRRGVIRSRREDSGAVFFRPHASNAEAQNLDRAVPLDQHIGWMHAAMNHAMAVGVIQPVTNLAADVQHVPNGVAFAFRNRGRDAEPFHKFRGYAKAPVDFAGAVEQNNILMAEVTGTFRFLDQALDQLRPVVSGQI